MVLKRFFGDKGGGDKKTPPAFDPARPWDLPHGSFLRMGFIAPAGLARAELQVTGAHALDFGPQRVRRVLTLETADARFLMWRAEDGGLAFGRAADRPAVARVFDLDEFARLFDPDLPHNVVLERRGEPADMEGWTAPIYRQERAQQAYWHDRDPLTDTLPDGMADGVNGFDAYRVVSDDRRHIVEIAVFDGGRTDVTFAARLDTGAIDEMWAA